jgi:hypothetical protein
VQLLTRTGLDWTAKYPNTVAALASIDVKIAYLDGELCGVDDAGLPSFARIQATTDGERGVRLVYYALISCISTVGMFQRCPSSSAKPFLRLWSQASPAFSSTVIRPATANSS